MKLVALRMKIVFCTFIFAFILKPAQSLSQDSCFIATDNQTVVVHSFDDGKYKEATGELDYSKDVMEHEKSKKKFSFKGFNIDPDLAKVIFFSIIIGLLTFILIKIIGSKKSGDQKVSDVEAFLNDSDLIENIHETDLQKLLSEAMQSENLRRAIRFYYLLIIKELSIQQLINWRKEKTNLDYMVEMMNNSLSGEFNKATYIFEKVWYGDFTVNENEFQLIHTSFDSLLSVIRKNNPSTNSDT